MRIAAVVEEAWDPVSIELGPVSGEIDWSRAASAAGPGVLEAVEMGLRLGDVTACGVGPAETALRQALAMGAAAVRAPDRWALAVLLAREAFDLVLVSWRSGDHGPSPLGPWLAGQLGLPQATAVDDLRVEAGEAFVRRRLDGGARVELALPLPAVIAVEPGVVAPRLASPAALVAAQAAPVRVEPPVPRPPRQPVLLGHQPPRPAPPRARAPDPGQPAEARIAAITGAGTDAGGRRRELASGPPEDVARRIVKILEERGYLTPPRRET